MTIKRCLFPTDFGPLAIAAAPLAQSLVNQLGASLDVLHVLRFIVPPPAPSEAPTLSPLGPLDDHVDKARALAQLTAFADHHFPALAQPPHTSLRIGAPMDEIIAHARESRADLLIVPTHADGILHRVIFGSVSKSILEHAPCPVLMIPAAAASAVA